MTDIPQDHPRYLSLLTRERIVEGVKVGITSMQGLIAQGRGECFDYLLGEKTHQFATESERVAAAMLILAEHPIISVNGNTAALVPEQMIRLSEIVSASLEVNLFHRTDERVNRIIDHLMNNGASEVLGGKGDANLPLSHARGIVDKNGIFSADVVLVPLEDGDRCETLVGMGKKVITIDLNPLSRTSRTATVSIVDNVVRALDVIADAALGMQDWDREQLVKLVESYDNKVNLKMSLDAINENLRNMANEVL
ncbi:4-phosphopantoate--beta-alanine ligase [Methanohalophilus sp.]|uniref:4-phosphopantoate--beta-alanine ligase n=1 Tax=Methanohalophilus sp. TaxID=1966352 RepID=UPI00262415BF|nr:4-phosphopantoate--beta-alanine ligase [Methanohalophilus sp.]MDK2893100.1 4-phosphopantoate---beta-alanine ligase [Methanohalophilus sp.]